MALRPFSGTVTIPGLHSFVPARRSFAVCLFAVNLSDLLAILRRLVLRPLSPVYVAQIFHSGLIVRPFGRLVRSFLARLLVTGDQVLVIDPTNLGFV